MADLIRSGLNNQKRGISVFVSDEIDTDANNLCNLPKRSLVTNVLVYVKTADTTAGATIDVKVGSTVISDEVNVASTGVKNSTTPAYFPTGGVLQTAAGSTAPNKDGCIRVVVEYVELDKTIGEYTEV